MDATKPTYSGSEIAYLDGELHVEDVPLTQVAERVETPVYVYSLALMRRRYEEFSTAVRAIDRDALVCFAIKALSNQVVLEHFASWGAGADLTSRGELERSVAAGFAPDKMVFSGLGKTDDDLDRAIQLGIQVNVESGSELRRLQARARVNERRARVAIRLNPQLEAMRGNLGQITTGKPDSKFGIPWDQSEKLIASFPKEFPDLELVGVSVHIGSNMRLDADAEERQSFVETFKFLNERVIPALTKARHVPRPIVIDLGGGVGVDYEQTPGERPGGEPSPSPDQWLVRYVDDVREAFGKRVEAEEVKLVFEPGRFLCGEAGVLLTTVLHLKPEPEVDPPNSEESTFDVRFLIVDAGMNDLLRPALYGAYHHIVPVRWAGASEDRAPVDVCGPVCETTDSFMRPTREWLRRYHNLYVGDAEIAQDDAIRRDDKIRQDDGTRQGPRRKLQGSGTPFGEAEPKYLDSKAKAASQSEPHTSAADRRRTYEYFVKRWLPCAVKRGHRLAILNAGAYGAVMASEFNTRQLTPEVLVDGDQFAVIRARPTYEEMMGRDHTSEWIGSSGRRA